MLREYEINQRLKQIMKNICSKFNAKNIIALTITGIAAFVTIYVTTKSIYNDKINDLITKSIIPLIGTWMGAIIAYYFAKENFDAAANQYNKVIDKLTPEKKLKSIKVIQAMIPYNRIVWSDLNEFKDKKIISEIIDNPLYKGFNRFLFFENKECKYIIHRSTFDRFITQQLVNNDTNSIQELKLSNLLNSSDDYIKEYLKNGIKFLSDDSNLFDAKTLIDNNKYCSDVIITQNGKPNEEVLGWITEVEISKSMEN